MVEYLEEIRMQQENLLNFPVIIIYFVFLCTVVLWHEDTANVSQVERNFRTIMEGTSFEGVSASSGHKTMEDIDTVTDIYLFLKEAMMPLWIPALSDRHPKDTS